MLYRVILKSTIGKIYYLASENPFPETDAEINLDEIQFLSKLTPTHAHTFSTKELAEQSISNLSYPYNDKCSIMSVSSKNDPIVFKIYYRILKNDSLWATEDKKFIQEITNDTANFVNAKDAQEFFSKLNIFDRKRSCICEIYDYGEPDWKFEINSKSYS